MHMHIGGKENDMIFYYMKIKYVGVENSKNPPRLSSYTQTREH